VAVKVCEYVVPAMAFGKTVESIARGLLTTMDRVLVAVCAIGWVLSVVWTVKL
jgi:hypothetical protein